MPIDTQHFKDKLEEEKKALEKNLSEVARKNPDSPSNWEAIPTERDSSQADDNIAADAIEEYEDNGAVTTTLEVRYKDLVSALDKIKHNVYGHCQICKKEIEPDRLEASPAARTCKTHMNPR